MPQSMNGTRAMIAIKPGVATTVRVIAITTETDAKIASLVTTAFVTTVRVEPKPFRIDLPNVAFQRAISLPMARSAIFPSPHATVVLPNPLHPATLLATMPMATPDAPRPLRVRPRPPSAPHPKTSVALRK